jgi:D-alanyl-D-alanine carboxypeptidase (penicillin-binding protein 5/6)
MRPTLRHPIAPPRRTPARETLPIGRLAAAVLAAVLACALVATPGIATASRLATDRVGERTLSQAPDLTRTAPDVVAPAGILETPDGRVLWARDADARRAMASTTKIMTALVVLRHARLTDVATVSTAAANVGESGAGLVPGERLTVRQLLEAMLVKSANDCAFALAEHVGGTVPGFVAMMNDEARTLGLTNTHYANPHGLDATGLYASAADLAKLGRVVMSDPVFRSIVGMRQVTLPYPGGRHITLQSSDHLLGNYPGIEGIKTGWTDKAGYCLISAAKRGDVELFGVILGTGSEQARFTQSARLLDWGFEHYRRIQVTSANAGVGSIPVTDYLDRDIVAEVAETTSPLLFDLGGAVTRRYELRPSVTAPVKAGDVVGSVSALQGSRVLARVDLVASGGVPEPGFWERAGIFMTRTWRAVFGPRTGRAARVTVTD